MHRNRTEQQATEARHVGHFLELAQLEAQAIPGDRPDCILVVGGRRIGLEHQELTEEDLASTSLNLAWLQDALATELRRRGADRDLHVAVSVNAASPRFRRRRELKELVRRVAAFALERAPAVSRGDELQVFARQLYPLGIVGPEFVYISRTSGALEGPLATVSRGFWGPGDSAVVEAIRAKEKLLPTYAADPTLSEVWLLLVTGEGYQQATDSVLTKDLRVPTRFPRVYLMDLRPDELHRVDDHQAD